MFFSRIDIFVNQFFVLRRNCKKLLLLIDSKQYIRKNRYNKETKNCGNNKREGMNEEKEPAYTCMYTDYRTCYCSVQNLIENGDDEPMGTINGENISKAYFKMRSELYRVCGAEKPAASAWEELKLEAAERGFAEAKGILPDEDEILEYTKQQRETAESTEESHNTVREMLQNIGMTEDYYWNVYKLKYESPVILTKGNIEKYKTANNIDKVDYKEVEAVITDKDYYESLN